MDSEEVLIVARTRFGKRVCIGAVTRDGWEARRLLPAGGSGTDGNFWPSDAPFRLGSMFEIHYETPTVETPHVEDVVVHEHRRMGAIGSLRDEISQRADIFDGALTEAFDGTLVEKAGNGNIGVGKARIPAFSTQFWRADEDMERADTTWNTKTQRRLKTADGVSVSYVGDDDAPDSIRVDDLVRLSLARWWDTPPRCWLQISHVYAD